ncbi:MAG: sugar phosphate nucleotidyltransferase [bacterium]|nr:sugar phosphate nucleotidyltransferase [bacterium]
MEYLILDTSKVQGVVCAGGDGTRIEPLSRFRAKPAIPIGGNNRLVDIMLSNLLNSSITHVHVIVQRRPQSLIRHLEGYANGVAQMRGQYVRVLAPPKEDDRFFLSDADSLLQLRSTLLSNGTEIFLVVMADQVVKVDFRQFITAMLQADADAAMVYRAVPVAEARGQLGVLEIDPDDRVRIMQEKPDAPQSIPGRPGFCHANLAMYAIRRQPFVEMLDHIAASHQPEMTLSRSGIPWLINNCRVLGYDLETNSIPGVEAGERGFFADTGTIEAWYQVQMMLCDRQPPFNLYGRQWPMYTAPLWPISPAKFDRVGGIDRAVFGPDAICQDDVHVTHSVVSSGTVVGRGSVVADCILLNDVQIGSNCRLLRVVVDKEVAIPDGRELSPQNPPPDTVKFADMFRQLKAGEPVPNTPVLSEGGILVIPKGYRCS